MTMPIRYYEQPTRRLRHFFVPIVCFILVLYAVGLSAVVLTQPSSTPRQERSFKCEKDGVVFFKGTVRVEAGNDEAGFLRLVSDHGETCRLFEHTDPVK